MDAATGTVIAGTIVSTLGLIGVLGAALLRLKEQNKVLTAQSAALAVQVALNTESIRQRDKELELRAESEGNEVAVTIWKELREDNKLLRGEVKDLTVKVERLQIEQHANVTGRLKAEAERDDAIAECKSIMLEVAGLRRQLEGQKDLTTLMTTLWETERDGKAPDQPFLTMLMTRLQVNGIIAGMSHNEELQYKAALTPLPPEAGGIDIEDLGEVVD